MGVEFDEKNDIQRPNYYSQTPKSKIGTWLIAIGIAKDEASANKIQVGAAILFILITLFVILG